MNKKEDAIEFENGDQKPFVMFIFKCEECRRQYTSFQVKVHPHIYGCMVKTLMATKDEDFNRMVTDSEGTRMHMMVPEDETFKCPRCRELGPEGWNEEMQSVNFAYKGSLVQRGEMANVLEHLGGMSLRAYVPYITEKYDALTRKFGWDVSELACQKDIASRECNRMGQYKDGLPSVRSFPEAIFNELEFIKNGHCGLMYRGIKSCDPFKPLSLVSVKGHYGSNWEDRVRNKVAPWIAAERALFAAVYHVNRTDGIHKGGRHDLFTDCDAEHPLPRVRYLTNSYGLTSIRQRLVSYLVFPYAASRDYLRQVIDEPVATKRAREETNEKRKSF